MSITARCSSRIEISVGTENYSVFEPVRCQKVEGHDDEHKFMIQWNDEDAHEEGET